MYIKKQKEKRVSYILVISLFISSILPFYTTWVLAASFFLMYCIFHIKHLCLPKFPGGSFYFLMIFIYAVVGIIYFQPNSRGIWPYIRDIVFITDVYVLWFFARQLASRYKSDWALLFRTLVLFAAIISFWNLCLRITGFQSAGVDFSSFVADGAISEFTLAIGLYLAFFKPPIVGKYYFRPLIDHLIELLMALAFLLSFSRTTLLIVLCLVLIGGFERIPSIVKILVLTLFGMIVASYLIPGVLETFFAKIENSLKEISTSNTWNDYNVVTNWRGYEVYKAKEMFGNYNIFQKFFGKGVGTFIDVGKYAYLVTSEEALPLLHNGYYTTLIKGGFVGIFLTIGYNLSNIYYFIKKDIGTYEKRFCIGLFISMMVTMIVIHGVFWSGAKLMIFTIPAWAAACKK